MRMQRSDGRWLAGMFALAACGGTPVTSGAASPAPSGGEASASPAPIVAASDPASMPPQSSAAPSSAPSASPAPEASASPAPSGQIVVGLIFDQAMSHTQVGVVVWREGRRDPVINAGRILGGCTTDSYASLVPHARTRDVVIAVGCDGRGVAPSALSVVEVVKHGDELIIRTADVLTVGRRLAHEHVVQRVPLHGATAVRAATNAESLRAREETPTW